jgi:hypothetical protein
MALFLCALVIWRNKEIQQGEKNRTLVSIIPLASFWAIVKSLSWAQFWYPIISPGFMFCFAHRKKLFHIVLALFFMQGLRSAALISGYLFGVRESQETVNLMRACMFTCMAN